MRFYPLAFRLFFSWMDAEQAHHLGFGMIKLSHRLGAGRLLYKYCAPDPSLAVTALGKTFPSPFGLAAGFDKQGDGVAALSDLGFGHIEVGTVTAQAQPGNPKPRLFRLVTDRALINRMGFNNDGAAAVAPRLVKAREELQNTGTLIGVNIGKTKVVPVEEAIDDYVQSTTLLAPLADYLVVNVSSPNTPGLRSLQGVETLRPLLEAVQTAAQATVLDRQIPLCVKIAPDLSNEDLDAIAHLAMDLGLAGIICTNTTITREGLRTDPETVMEYGVGGLSGAPLKARSLEVLKRLREVVGERIDLISVGGVETPYDVQQRLDAGATLVQGYTAFLYEGPFWARQINKYLLRQRKVRSHQATI